MSSSAWLVDMGYIVKAAKESSMRLDYMATESWLAGKYGSTRTFLFNSYDVHYGTPSGLQAFYDAMTRRGSVVRLHPMRGGIGDEPHRQRRVDVDIASHAVWQAATAGVDRLVLSTGDQDLIPAVEMCRDELGVSVVLLTFLHNVSRELAGVVDEHLLFEDYRQELERRGSDG